MSFFNMLSSIVDEVTIVAQTAASLVMGEEEKTKDERVIDVMNMIGYRLSEGTLRCNCCNKKLTKSDKVIILDQVNFKSSKVNCEDCGDRTDKNGTGGDVDGISVIDVAEAYDACDGDGGE
jgi:hypothetical protein